MNRRNFFFIGTGAAAAAVTSRPARAQVAVVQSGPTPAGSQIQVINWCEHRGKLAFLGQIPLTANAQYPHESAGLLFQAPTGELHLCRWCSAVYGVAAGARDRR